MRRRKTKRRMRREKGDGPLFCLTNSRKAYLPVVPNLNTVGALREGHPVFED
jgi:hypothetical protein